MGWIPVDEEAWSLGISAEVLERVEVDYLEALGSEISSSGVLVIVEAEDAEAWHLQAASAVKLPVGEEIEAVEILHLGADFAVELEDLEASSSVGFAERSGDAEVEDVELLYSGGAVGFLAVLEIVDVGVLYLGGAEVEEGAVAFPGDAEVGLGAEVEKGAVGFPGDAEAEKGAVGFPGDVEVEEGAEVEVAAAVQSEASAVETLVVVEATQVFGLAFDSSDCSPELGSAFSQEDSYSLPSQEREPLREMGLETNAAADCWRARDCDRAATSEGSEDDAEAR